MHCTIERRCHQPDDPSLAQRRSWFHLLLCEKGLGRLWYPLKRLIDNVATPTVIVRDSNLHLFMISKYCYICIRIVALISCYKRDHSWSVCVVGINLRVCAFSRHAVRARCLLSRWGAISRPAASKHTRELISTKHIKAWLVPWITNIVFFAM